MDLACTPDLLDLVQNLIGKNIILWGCHIFSKSPCNGLEVPMHQDGG
jgi:hypothetical protein